jgi:tetratricopeptide (TPR) repeat protein
MKRNDLVFIGIAGASVVLLCVILYLAHLWGSFRLFSTDRTLEVDVTSIPKDTRVPELPKPAPGRDSGQDFLQALAALPEPEVSKPIKDLEPGPPLTDPAAIEAAKKDAEARKVADADRSKVLKEARSALDPHKGITRLKEFVTRAEQAYAKSIIYTALGQLYTSVEPPDIPHAEEAFENAIETAKTREQLEEAAFAAAAMYQTQKRTKDAITKIEKALEGRPVSVRSLQLRILLGSLYSEEGNRKKSKEAYGWAVLVYEDHIDKLGGSGRVFYEQACQQLAREFRLDGDESTANAIVRRFRARAAASTGN